MEMLVDELDAPTLAARPICFPLTAQLMLSRQTNISREMRTFNNNLKCRPPFKLFVCVARVCREIALIGKFRRGQRWKVLSKRDSVPNGRIN